MSICQCPNPIASSKVTEPRPLDARTPLLFLPVGVETRFMDTPQGPQLWVRIFSDQISINAHEPALTSREISDGQVYWNAIWAAGDPAPCGATDPLQMPWRDLASRYGAPRAAWIACQTTPPNANQQPAAASLTLKSGVSTITFTSCRLGATDNKIQIAIDVTSSAPAPVAVNGSLITIYAKWDGTLHTTTDVAAYFPSPKTSDGGSVAAIAAGIPSALGATSSTNLSGGRDASPPPYPDPTNTANAANAGKKKATDSSWEQAAVADALPDRWTVVLVSGAEKSWSQSTQPVRAGLHVSLNLNGQPFPAGSPVDADLQWLVDFQEAWNAGMALTIPINAQQRSAGFDRLFVYGLRTTDSSGSDTMGNLLDAHHYSDGFALVPQGAATNNTPDASSAYSRKDTDNAISFQVERRGPLIQDPQQQPDADGNRFATLIGLDPCKMKHVRYADETGSRNGSDMLTALWPSTLGYFLSQMMAATLNANDIEDARQYIVANALPRGPIAGFRVGRTPYGVLPVTSLLRYKLGDESTGGSTERNLVDLLRSLRPAWLAASQNAPHMQATGDPDNQLVSVLGMDVSSMAFRGRQVYGNYLLWNYSGFAGMSPTATQAWVAEQASHGRQALDSFGYKDLDPRVIHLGLANDSFPVQLPTVQTGPLSETDRLANDADLSKDNSGKTGMVNYIQWLQQASVDAIRTDSYPGPKPTSLLYKILRQSVIVEYARNASAVEISAGRLQPSQIREAELVGMGKVQEPAPVSARAATVGEPVGVWEVLERPIDPSSNVKWKDYLVQIAPQPGSNFPALNDLYASMSRLATLPTAELDRLLTETLDACSHRLDVWATTIATAILQRDRKSGRRTVNLACYGWVEEVRPGAQRALVQGAAQRQVKNLDARRGALMRNSAPPGPVLEPLADNGGFILAPSPDQAMVAAILRSGFMNHRGTSDEGVLSMDLSSERVRGALWLLEGVRQGQSLNALLGYQFEAGLHDLGLSKYIQPFRDLFPMSANQVIPSNQASDIVAAPNVVDGLALRSAWDQNQFPVGSDWGTDLPGADQSQDQQAVLGLFQKLDSQAEALGELSIAETIFQTVHGNFSRAGGLLDAISKGNRPPDPAVIATPKGGLDLTHRIAVLFRGSAPQNSWQAWQTATPRARAQAEPWLDAWLSLMLPDPTAGPQGPTVVCQVSYVDPSSGDQKTPPPVSLADLNLAPLDCVAMGECSTGSTQRSELEMRILFAAGVPPLADPGKIKINYPPSAGSAISFPDLVYLWKNFRLLINHARPLTPQDLALPENKVDPNTVLRLQELRGRAKAALAALQTDLANLKNTDVPSRPKYLMACSFYGVPGSVPFSSFADDARLPDQAKFVVNALQDRYNKASQLITDTAGLDDLLNAFALIFGKDFKVLAGFTPADPKIQDALNESSALLGSDPSPSARWWTQLTHTRPAVARMDAALSLAQLVGAAAASPANLQVAQLPFVQNDQWLALPFDPSKPPNKGRVAFACFTQSGTANLGVYSGLLMDEWLERIPSTEEKAGVAFHYEEPRARPPQALLLGVCPDSREVWNDDLVTGILEETLELAKIRTVDLDSVQKTGQILPALYFPFNLRGATVSIDFANLKEAILAPAIVR